MSTMKYEEAKRIVDAGFAAASKAGINVAIAVLDERGDIVLHTRMDGCRWWWTDACVSKAMASAIFGQPSGALPQIAGRPMGDALVVMHGGKVAFVQGALPVTRDGQLIGAVGVGGGTGEQDEEVARVGIAAM